MLKAGDGGGNLVTTFELVGEEGIVSAIVESVACCKGSGNIGTKFLIGLACDERTRSTADAETGNDNIGRADKVDGNATSVHIIHIIEKAGSSTTCSDNDILEISYFM